MKNSVLTAEPTVQRTAAMDYLIPFEDSNFTLTEQTIDAHHVPRNTVRNSKLSYFDIIFTSYKHPELRLEVPFGKIYTKMRIAIFPTHLLIACSCDEHPQKLCTHTHKILSILASRRGADYFSRFYKPDLFKLAEGYPDLFEAKTSLEGIRFEASKTLGSVYIPSQKIYIPQSEPETDQQQPTITHDQVGYSLYTIFRQEHFPFLAGFTGQLLNGGSAIKSFSTIFQTSAAPEHIVFTDQQLMLNAIGSRIQTATEQLLQIQKASTTQSLEEVVSEYTACGLSQIQTYRQRLLDLWSRAHPLLAGERFVNRYSDGRKIKFDHKPKKGYTKPFQAASSELGVSFTLTKHEACYRLQLHVLKDTIPMDYYELFPARSPLFVFDKRSGIYLIASTLRDIDLITSLTITGQVLTVMDIHFERFNRSVLQFLTRHYPFQYDSVSADQRILQVQQMQLRLFEHAGSFCFQPQVDYGRELLVPTLSAGYSWIEMQGQPVIFIRDKAKEARLTELVRSLHTDFASQACKNEDYFSMPKTTVLNTGCLPDMLLKLKENQITVTGIEDIEALADYLNLVDIRMGIHADKDWFEITLKASCSQIAISNDMLRHAILENDGQLTLKDGTRATIPASWQKKLKTVLSFSQASKSGMRLSGFHAQLLDHLNDQSGQQGLQGFADNLKSHAKVKVIADRQIPENVRATLRAYQKEGFDWLMLLKDNGWGGILADDMGLGKTLQVLTLLQKVYQNGLHNRPSLLIVPTSLLFNWQQEAEKFTPDLRVVRYHGAFRQQLASSLDSGDVILTTYKTVLHDIAVLKSVEFEYVILDEAQAIKNPSSQRYKAVSILDARFRLAMTGTPVENSGNDLYALMNFVNPGMLGSLRGFNKLLSNKAETDGNAHLQKVINTFILRRTKQQVAKDLPEKTEMVIYCEMEKQQREVYETYRLRYQQAIKEKMNENAEVNSKLYALAGLLKLRQICNAPVLVEPEINQEAEPAKIRELMRRLKEITPLHKVLVFSSFTGFLGLISQQLDASQIGYAYLDGKTKEDQRSKMVNLFQNDNHTRAFLISLKAGGTGLNLTAAEYVFLVDPWWNPAAESQAIDRCYRIGQTNKVMAYRMICKDTLEEKILNMQAEKRQLADELISATDGVLKTLSAEDILELFS